MSRLHVASIKIDPAGAPKLEALQKCHQLHCPGYFLLKWTPVIQLNLSTFSSRECQVSLSHTLAAFGVRSKPMRRGERRSVRRASLRH